MTLGVNIQADSIVAHKTAAVGWSEPVVFEIRNPYQHIDLEPYMFLMHVGPRGGKSNKAKRKQQRESRRRNR